MRKISRDKIRANILELCSESEYGSWEFWSPISNKTESEARLIVKVLADLVKEKKIYPTEHKNIADQTYGPVQLNKARLANEIRQSMKPGNIDPHRFYWFLATEKGKKEDLLLRSK